MNSKNFSPVHAPRLMDVNAVALLCDCSVRTVRRLNDAGRMPAPVRVGRLLKWDRGAIDAWLSAGCPDLRRSA